MVKSVAGEVMQDPAPAAAPVSAPPSSSSLPSSPQLLVTARPATTPTDARVHLEEALLDAAIVDDVPAVASPAQVEQEGKGAGVKKKQKQVGEYKLRQTYTNVSFDSIDEADVQPPSGPPPPPDSLMFDLVDDNSTAAEEWGGGSEDSPTSHTAVHEDEQNEEGGVDFLAQNIALRNHSLFGNEPTLEDSASDQDDEDGASRSGKRSSISTHSEKGGSSIRRGTYFGTYSKEKVDRQNDGSARGGGAKSAAKALLTSPTPPPSIESKPQQDTEPQVKPGDRILAQYHGDGLHYVAVVIGLHGDAGSAGQYEVEFEGYEGVTEFVDEVSLYCSDDEDDSNVHIPTAADRRKLMGDLMRHMSSRGIVSSPASPAVATKPAPAMENNKVMARPVIPHGRRTAKKKRRPRSNSFTVGTRATDDL